MDELKKFGDRHQMNADQAVRRESRMNHDQRNDRHGGVLYPLLLAAAVAVIVFSIIGIATMTGVMPSASGRDTGGRHSAAEPDRKPARIDAPRGDPAPRAGNPRSAMNGAAWYPARHA